jgi:hypothetical protein
MHQGMTHHVRPKCQNDIGVGHPQELMTLLGEMSYVISEKFTRLLPATLDVLGIARSHIRAPKVGGENLPKILPAVDDVSR